MHMEKTPSQNPPDQPNDPLAPIKTNASAWSKSLSSLHTVVVVLLALYLARLFGLAAVLPGLFGFFIVWVWARWYVLSLIHI